MTQQLATEKASLPAEGAVESERVRVLQRERDAELESVQSLEEQESRCRTAVDAVKKDNFEIRRDLETNQQREVIDVPHIKHAMSLYANITNIKWDYAAEQVAGTIVDPHTGSVRRFALDSDAGDAFELADSLWAQVASA